MLADRRISFVKSYVATDLADMRAAFKEDATFANALASTARELHRACKSPTTWGAALRHDLIGWRRSAYASTPQGDTDLRLIVRPRADGSGIDVLMFGVRYLPDTTSAYVRARTRI